jgi:hypothetical protein
MSAVNTRKQAGSAGVIEFALSMSTLIYRLAEMQRLFHSEELAKELENKGESEIRAILKERFRHIYE